MDDISARLAQSVKARREARGLSQKALADESGVPRPTIAHLESGQANPTLAVVLKVARALGVSTDELIEPPEHPIRILSLRAFPTERTSRLRRVTLTTGLSRDGDIERVSFKTDGRITVTPGQGVEVLVCERGRFVLQSGDKSEPLGPEEVAFVRAPTDVVALEGGHLYRLSGK